MVYGQYMEDWDCRDKAPLSTQVYPGRSHLSQPTKKQQQQESPHTPGFHLGGSPGISRNLKD